MALSVFFFVLLLSPLSYARILEKDTADVVQPTLISHVDSGFKYNEELCEACELLSGHLSSLLSDSNVTELIVSALQTSLCGKLTGNIEKQCELYVEEYIPDIISALEASLATGDLCANQQICDYQNKKMTKTSKSNSKCDLCQVAATEMKNLIQKNETQAQILSVLYSVCSKIKGGSVAGVCQNVVDAYYPDVLDIISSLSASEFCTYVGYCSLSRNIGQLKVLLPSISTKKVQKMGKSVDFARAMKQPGDCFACKMMVAYFRNKLKDEENQEKFKNTLLTSCEKVPNYIEECRAAVIEYLPALYSNVDTIFNSTVICEKAGACTPHFISLIRL